MILLGYEHLHVVHRITYLVLVVSLDVPYVFPLQLCVSLAFLPFAFHDRLFSVVLDSISRHTFVTRCLVYYVEHLIFVDLRNMYQAIDYYVYVAHASYYNFC